jgi:hypothetical protein
MTTKTWVVTIFGKSYIFFRKAHAKAFIEGANQLWNQELNTPLHKDEYILAQGKGFNNANIALDYFAKEIGV